MIFARCTSTESVSGEQRIGGGGACVNCRSRGES
jgi:hypothetical protein